MKTLLIYDNAGMIWANIAGDYLLPDGLPCIEAEIPAGYCAVSVNVDTKEPVLAALPLTEAQRLSELEAQMAALTGTE